jgi:hypothetical protein
MRIGLAVDSRCGRYQNRVPMASRRELLEAEITRLHAELASLDRQWARKYWLGLFALAAVPAWFLSETVAMATLISSPILVGVRAYLLAVRREECRQLIHETQRELQLLDAAPA